MRFRKIGEVHGHRVPAAYDEGRGPGGEEQTGHHVEGLPVGLVPAGQVRRPHLNGADAEGHCDVGGPAPARLGDLHGVMVRQWTAPVVGSAAAPALLPRE